MTIEEKLAKAFEEYNCSGQPRSFLLGRDEQVEWMAHCALHGLDHTRHLPTGRRVWFADVPWPLCVMTYRHDIGAWKVPPHVLERLKQASERIARGESLV